MDPRCPDSIERGIELVRDVLHVRPVHVSARELQAEQQLYSPPTAGVVEQTQLERAAVDAGVWREGHATERGDLGHFQERKGGVQGPLVKLQTSGRTAKVHDL